ncbi:unnamed protein product [Peniophora sp. CBMAI 1063]|nr:unnamed protein product [Peniophora sp. CBMAI 1063]
MLSLRSLVVVACSLSVPSVFAAQCAATLSKGNAVATRLQSYYSSSSGSYNGGGRWTDANAVEDVHNFMLGAGVTTWDTLGNTWDVVTAAKANANLDWYSYNQGFNDDAQWLILALYKIFDYKNTHGQDSSFYLDTAKKIYTAVAAEWDDTCGGGVWWSTDHTYKNAITNELFLYTSARGYQITGDSTYLANAQKAWAWLKASGMRNSQGLWNDGLDSNTCQNNGQNTWTYNQGVILAGLGQMYQITGDSTYITEAQTTLDAVDAHLTSGGVIKDTCDNSSGSSQCTGDGAEFKGAFMKHLQYFLDNAGSASQTKYKDFVTRQYNAIVKATNSNNDVGSSWYSGTAGSAFGIVETDSGLAGITNAAKWGSC